jgi:outer membrane protein assembly factor BamA
VIARRALLRILIAGASAASLCVKAPAAVAASLLFDGWSVQGDALLVERDLERLVAWTRGDSLAAGELDRAAGVIEAALVERGWWNAKVRVAPVAAAEDTAAVVRTRVVAEIAAGEPATLGTITVVGNRVLAREEVLALVDLREGSRVDAIAMRAGVDRILRAYAERGHPLARVSPGRFRAQDDGRLAWTIQVGEGPETFFEELRVVGRSSTSPDVVARIAGVRPGSRWDSRRLEEVAPRLRREELFSYVGEPRVVRGSRDNQLGIEVQVESRKTSSILGVLGYVPETGGGGTVVGLVDLRLGNILGTARRAELHFERSAQDVRDISFRYREPWLLGSPISVEVGAAQALRDTLYSRTDLDLAISVPIGWRASAFLAGERRTSSFDTPPGEPALEELSTGGSFGLAVDHRDDRLDPSRGFAGSARVGLRQTETDITRTRLECGLEGYRGLGGRWIFSEAVGYRGVWASEGDVPLSDQYYFGGTNTLRGYREEQLHGEKVWWARTELRYRLARRSRAYMFADVGGYEFEERDASGAATRQDDVLGGAGMGLAVGTRSAGLLRVEIALGRGDGFSDAKVHAALEQEF